MERAKDDRKKSESGDKSKGKPKVTHPLIDAAALLHTVAVSAGCVQCQHVALPHPQGMISTPPDTSS